MRRTVQWYLEHRAWCEAVRAGAYDGQRLGLQQVTGEGAA